MVRKASQVGSRWSSANVRRLRPDIGLPSSPPRSSPPTLFSLAMSSSDLQTRNSRVPSQQGSRYQSDLAEYELESNRRLPFLLSLPEVKLLGIAGVSRALSMVTRPKLMFSVLGRILPGWCVCAQTCYRDPLTLVKKAYDLFIINVSPPITSLAVYS